MITPQSDNFQARLDAREGQRFDIIAYIEDVADVPCTHEPADGFTPLYSALIPDTTEAVQCGTSSALTQLPDWTAVAWVKPRSFAAGETIAGAWNAGTTRGYRVFTDATGALFVSITGTASIALGLSLTLNAWNFVAVGCGGDTGTILLVVVNSSSAIVTNATTRASRNVWTGGTTFILSLKDSYTGYAAVYNRGLTLDEIRLVKYRLLTAAWGNDDSEGLWDDLVAQWAFERGKGTVVANTKSPGTHNGTFDAGVTWTPEVPFTVTYRAVLSAATSFSQEIEPIATKTSISGGEIQLLDTDAWFTTVAADLGLVIQGKRVRLHMGFMGMSESECQPVFTGVIKDVDHDARGYRLTLGDPLVEGKKRLQLGRSTLDANISNVQTTLVVDGSSIYWWDATTKAGANFLGDVRIDSEIIEYDDANTISVGELQFTNCTRGAHSTGPGVAHSAGATVTEILYISNQHLLTTALRLMLSGSGTYHKYNSEYDDLPTVAVVGGALARASRGMGLSPSEVAISEIEDLRDNVFTDGVYSPSAFPIENDSNDVKDFVEKEILAALGCYFYTKSDGRVSIATNKIPVIADSVRTLDPSTFRRARLRFSHSSIVNHLEVQSGWSASVQAYLYKTSYSDVTSGGRFGLKKREFTFLAFANGPHSDWSTDTFARFAAPYRRAEITCPIFEMLLEIADPITFTDFWLPNFQTGQLGVHKQLWQVAKRTMDYKAGEVTLELADLSDA